MSDQQVTVTACIKAKPGMEEVLKQEILGVIVQSRTEPGCMNYDLHQSQDDPSLFLLHENWVSQAALEAHLVMPYIQALATKQDVVVAEPVELSLWVPILTL